MEEACSQERETGFEPADSSLEGYCLTTWRLPQRPPIIKLWLAKVKIRLHAETSSHSYN